MDNAKIKELMKQEPQELVAIIKERVYTRDYKDDITREDIADYICAKVKGQIAPYLRLSRRPRSGLYKKWYDFNELLNNLKLQHILTRANKYSPIPKWVYERCGDYTIFELESYIKLFNEVHAEEDYLYDEIFSEAFDGWAVPALLNAFERVDITKSDREIVAYVSQVFYTSYVYNRATSQGLKRVRRGGKLVWGYTLSTNIDKDDFTDCELFSIVLHGNFDRDITLSWVASKLTKSQRQLIVKLYVYIREDAEKLTKEEFSAKYSYYRMNYRTASHELGIPYEKLVKTLQRIKIKLSN